MGWKAFISCLHVQAKCYRTERSGTIIVKFALLIPIVAVITGSTIDYAMLVHYKSRLQLAVDAAAMSAAKELSLADARTDDVNTVVAASVESLMNANGDPELATNLTTTVRRSPLEVEVRANQRPPAFFGFSLGLTNAIIEAHAVARVVGRPNICVLALEDSAPGAVWLVTSARLTGNDCSVFSNSTSSTSIAVRDNAMMEAKSICSAGGIDESGTISPAPYLDCPQFDDPLASRPEPVIGPCTHSELVIGNETRTLHPGVYCGGLKISGTSNVTFEPGVYIIKDRRFLLGDTAAISGNGVSFFLGAGTFLYFGPETSVSLEASKAGPLAGLLFFGSRSQSEFISHTILSRNAQNMVGTIYFPKNTFWVDGDASVGGASAYTAIVARRLVLLAGPHLVLNSNFDQTDVPVPDGIRGAAQPIMLTQ